MKSIAILLTVHNRREKTLSCLETCYAQIAALKKDDRYRFIVCLTDDGSTDGTSEAVLERFPDVQVIRGDGTLYWNHGMIAAWKAAGKAAPDFYLWINDDTIPCENAFQTLLETSEYLGHKDIVVGTAVDTAGNMSYGGRTRSNRLIEPGPIIPKYCDIFNGNIVLVPDSVYKILGTMDPCYSHGFGDYDYGVRAAKAGIISVVAPGVLATCNRNPGIPAWRNASKSLKQRYEALKHPKGRPLHEQFIYDTRLYNVFYAVGHFITLNLRVLFPRRK